MEVPLGVVYVCIMNDIKKDSVADKAATHVDLAIVTIVRPMLYTFLGYVSNAYTVKQLPQEEKKEAIALFGLKANNEGHYHLTWITRISIQGIIGDGLEKSFDMIDTIDALPIYGEIESEEELPFSECAYISMYLCPRQVCLIAL